MQFRSRAVGEEPRNEVRKVDEGIEQVNDKLLENTKDYEEADLTRAVSEKRCDAKS